MTLSDLGVIFSHNMCGKDVRTGVPQTAALRAAVFLDIRKKATGGGSKHTTRHRRRLINYKAPPWNVEHMKIENAECYEPERCLIITYETNLIGVASICILLFVYLG